MSMRKKCSINRFKTICENDSDEIQIRSTFNNRRNCDNVSNHVNYRRSCNSSYKNKQCEQLVTNDGTRGFMYSVKRASIYPLLWSRTEYSKLRTKAKIETLDDKLNEFKLNELQKRDLLEASEKRKKHLQEIDRERQLNSGILGNVLNEIVEHDKDLTSRKIIDRAFVAKQEQEEEVKRANRIILAAKCHIIRDAQIAEKQEIERELRADELRLEKIMLDENENALMEEERKAHLEKERITQHSEEIRNQLLEKEKMKLKEAERIEEEARVLKHAQLAIVEEEQHKEKKKINRINAIRDDLKKAYELSAHYKQLEFEEQRIAELKVQEYTRQRNERQAKLEFEKKIAIDVKEREQERMLKIQQKLMDTKSAKIDMDFRRGQEHVEREFRKREKEAVIKKRELEKQIANARAAQLEAVKTERAMQIARDNIDHKKAVEKFKFEELKEVDNVHKLLQLREKYRAEIIHQIKRKEQERREEEHCLKKEDSMMQDLTKKREMNIKSTIANKIKMMKESKVPERFIKDVERQLEAIKAE